MASTPASSSIAPAPALLFIPDISGFTQFVNDTEINHAQHIIRELLDILIETNEIGLDVSEVEGDAILFYKFGDAPTSSQLNDQVTRMFVAFHQHLKKYDKHRVCNCGACKSANALTLKFIAHRGDVGINKVQGFKKLFGIDVITAHRLLKNDIDRHEYFLLTKNLTSGIRDWNGSMANELGDGKTSSQEYDSGKVDYHYFHLDKLHARVPELKEEDFRLKGKTSKMMAVEGIVHAPLQLVFDVVSDVEWRGKWIPGTLPKTENINTYFPQQGQTHKCIANGPTMFMHDFKRENEVIYFSETADSQQHSCLYTFTPMEGERTNLRMEFFMPKNLLKELMFNLLMKRKFVKSCEQALVNLDQYCQDLLAKKKKHPYAIVLN